MATKNKCARLIQAAFELKKLKATEDAKKTFLRAFDSEDAEEVIDALENAEEETEVEEANVEDIEDVDAEDETTEDEEMTDEEVLEEVEAKVKQLKASARKKFLD